MCVVNAIIYVWKLDTNHKQQHEAIKTLAITNTHGVPKIPLFNFGWIYDTITKKMISLLSIENIRNLHLQVMKMESSQPLEAIRLQNLGIHWLNLSQRKMVLGIATMSFPYHSKFTKYTAYYSKNYKIYPKLHLISPYIPLNY